MSSTSMNSSTEPKLPTDTFLLHSSSNHNILHEKAQRAAQLHAELNALLDAQAQREARELAKPFGSSFRKFLKSNKKEMLNIFAAFMCVLLAWQITTMRKGARKLLESVEEKEQQIHELKMILRQIHKDDNLINQIVDRYWSELEIKMLDSQRSGFLHSLKLIFYNENGAYDRNELIAKSVLKETLRKELDGAIGTASLSDAEIEEKNMIELYKEMGFAARERSIRERPDRLLSADGNLDELLNSVNQAQSGDHSSSQTLTKKTKGFI